MLEFDSFYRKYGFNKLTQFLSPLVLKTNTIIFPYNSELHYFKVTEEPIAITKKEKILESHPKIFAKSVVGYGDENIVGKYIRQPVQVIKTLKELCVDKDIRYILPNMGNITIPRKSLLVYNYTTCQLGIKYHANLRKRLWKYQNLTNALVINTEKTLRERNVFVTFELPPKLPPREKLDQFNKDLTPQRIRMLDDYRYYNLLALWKFLTPETKENSWLSKWKREDRIRVNLLLMKDNGTVLMNLGLLEDIVKEYAEDKPEVAMESLYQLFTASTEDAKMISKGTFKAKDIRKQLFIFMNTLINKSPLSHDVVDTINKNEEVNDSLEIDIADKLNLDELIENEQLFDSDEFNDEDYEFSHDVDEEASNMVGEITNDEEDEYFVKVQDNTKDFLNVTAVYQDQDDDSQTQLNRKIESLKEDGQINRAKENTLKTMIVDQSKKTFKINGEPIPLETILDVNLDLSSMEVKNSPIRDIPSVFDKSYNQNKIKSLDKQYLNDFMVKDSIRVAYSFQKNGYIVEDYSVEETSNILDTTQLHTIKLKSLEGKSTTLKYYLPKINEDGSFKMSGNTYRMRKQRSETPIRKINARRVALSSYYGKLFIDKAYRRNYQFGSWYLRNLYKNPDVENIVEGETSYPDIKVNNLYGMLSKSIKSFIYNNYLFRFDYMSRSFDLPEDKVKDLEMNGIIIGKSVFTEEDYLVMNNETYQIYKCNSRTGAMDPWITFEEIIGVESLDEGPIEFASMKINGDYVPVVVLLSYYIGLEKLLKALNIKYFVDKHDEDSKEKKKLWDKDELKKMKKINFMDSTLYFQRDHGIGDMVLGGLTSTKAIRETLYSSWNSRAAFPSVYANLELSPSTQVEINVMENMFIDPMTLSLLKSMKEPETFKGLVLKAAELLVNDNYKHPNDVSGQVVKGYERLNGMLYRSLTRAMVKTEIESIFSNSRLTLDPYDVMKMIKDDSTTVNVDDLNPLATIKQSEDLSYLGMFGRDVITMVKKTRSIHPSEIGIVSEAVKDNGQVGVTAYLTADPNITNMRGSVEGIDASKEGWGKLFSTAGLLTQWGNTDDMKRLKC